MKTKDKKLYKLVTAWNEVIDSILEAKKVWEDVRLGLAEHPDLQILSIEGQKFLSRTTERMEFHTFLDYLLTTQRGVGGIENFRLETLELEEVVKPKTGGGKDGRTN